MFDKALDYDDVSLVTRHISTVKSRSDIQLKSDLFTGVSLTSPILAAPMSDVCDGQLALALRKAGGFGFIHRFNSIRDQCDEFAAANFDAGCAIGINDDYIERFQGLYDTGCRHFCIDVANGASIYVKQAIHNLLRYHDVEFIAGNVASVECYKYLSDIFAVKAVRVGIAGGHVCTTKYATGIYYPMISLLSEIQHFRLLHGHSELATAKVIADGGISNASRFCKALAAGADFVMLGSMLANTKESPAALIDSYKIYNGSSSFQNQLNYKDKPNYVEGTQKKLPYNGETVQDVVNTLMNGLRSSMSYMNATTLNDYFSNSNFVVIK